MTDEKPIYGGKNSPFNRGRVDCMEDANENNPFGSVGGLDARKELARPSWIPEDHWDEYRRGYEFQARRWWGDGWRDVIFSWQVAVTIDSRISTSTFGAKPP